MIDAIRKAIGKIDINDIYFENASSIKHEQKIGAYTFEFYVSYNTEVKNYISATYLTPEEGDNEYTITDISELYIYDFKNDEVRLKDEDIDRLVDLLKFNLVGQSKTNN